MVTIQKHPTPSKLSLHIPVPKRYHALGIQLTVLALFGILVYVCDNPRRSRRAASSIRAIAVDPKLPANYFMDADVSRSAQCPYTSLSDLTPDERFPRTSEDRHVIDPPKDSRLTLVCCQTTAGYWSIAVHHDWAPFGAQRFLEMVTSDYFNNQNVPLMRCVQDFLCQFGLAGEASSLFTKKIPDDPQWLPDKKHEGRRFRKGYFAYAGSGKNSRGRQLFVALSNSRSLGSSPWEVPWGELVGVHSYETLDKIYTGYGEHGPSQDLLLEAGSLEQVRKDFPQLDWILSCEVVDESATSAA